MFCSYRAFLPLWLGVAALSCRRRGCDRLSRITRPEAVTLRSVEVEDHPASLHGVLDDPVSGAGLVVVLRYALDLGCFRGLAFRLAADERENDLLRLVAEAGVVRGVACAVSLAVLDLLCDHLVSGSVPVGIPAPPADFVEFLAADLLEPLVPDRASECIGGVRCDALFGRSANQKRYALGVANEGFAVQVDALDFAILIQQDADDLFAVGQVDLCDLALMPAHGRGVDVVTSGNPRGHGFGKLLVDIFSKSLTGQLIERAEYRKIYTDAFGKYAINESALFRYAGRRHLNADIQKFIKEETDIQLKLEE